MVAKKPTNKKARILAIVAVVTVFFLVPQPGAAVIGLEMYDPVSIAQGKGAGAVGLLMTCANQAGEIEVYDVIEHQEGQYYSVFILKQVGGSKLRVGWNSQLPTTYEGVNTYKSWDGGPWIFNRAFDSGFTGPCGEEHGNVPSSGTVRVRVEFGGTDVSVTESSTTTHSISVSVNLGSEFFISLTNIGESRSVGFGHTGTWTVSQTTTVHIHGVKKDYTSSNIASTSVGPIEASLNALQTSSSSSVPAGWSPDYFEAENHIGEMRGLAETEAVNLIDHNESTGRDEALLQNQFTPWIEPSAIPLRLP